MGMTAKITQCLYKYCGQQKYMVRFLRCKNEKMI
jgi:hypothetical protein